MKIYPFHAILSYTSHSLNFYDLTNGNLIEFLNIFNINDLKLHIKDFDLKQNLKLDLAL